LVSAQILIVTIALLGFFATGGLSKVSGAVSTAKSDFGNLRGKVTDFQQSIVDQPKTNTEQLDNKERKLISKQQPILRNEGFNLGSPTVKFGAGFTPRPIPDILIMPKGNDFVRTADCRAGECLGVRKPFGVDRTGIDRSNTPLPIFDRDRSRPVNTSLTRVQALADIKKRGGFGFT